MVLKNEIDVSTDIRNWFNLQAIIKCKSVFKYAWFQKSPLRFLYIRKYNEFVPKLLHYIVTFTFNSYTSQAYLYWTFLLSFLKLAQCVSSFFLHHMIDLAGINKNIYSHLHYMIDLAGINKNICSCTEMLKGSTFHSEFPVIPIYRQWFIVIK